MLPFVLLAIVQISLGQYEKWVPYKFDAEREYVMYYCKKLNEDLAAKYPRDLRRLGVHVTVIPKADANGLVAKGTKGKFIHASWNNKRTNNGFIRWNDIHWGWTRRQANGAEVWWPESNNHRKEISQSKYEPLKQAYDLFAANGYTDPAGVKHDLFFEANKKDTGKLKPYPNPDPPPQQPPQAQQQQQQQVQQQQQQPQQQQVAKASIDYANDYKKNANRENMNHKPKHEDTESSISVPTVFVTLISCMFIFVVCAVYTGCIGLIAGLIGYKMKESQQTSKVQSFEEI